RSGRVVSLPRYPWRHERHWIDPSRRAPRRARRDGAHPFIAHRLKLAEPRGTEVFEIALDRSGAGALVDLFLAAGKQLGAESIEALVLEEPVLLGGDATGALQLIATPREGGFDA